jgi:hypothetical protein
MPPYRQLLILSVAPLIIAGAVHAQTAPASLPFNVTYETETPGQQTSTETSSSKFTVSGVENFNSEPVGYDGSFTTDFGTNGAITGVYQGLGKNYVRGTADKVQINAADQYGGAGGTGNYAVAFSNTPYEVTLSSAKSVGGVNYFGYWLSALDPGNFVTFYSGDKVLFSFNPQDVINAIDAKNQYYGNPNANFIGQDGGEPFVFLNFYDTTGSFSKVVFQEINYGGGYESDNHTVGHYTTESGTPVTLKNSGTTAPAPLPTGVPEPAVWTMMILGLGATGAVLRRRRAALSAVAA